MAQHAASRDRPYMMNLSAPFILEFFSDRFNAVLPYIDILFGNETVRFVAFSFFYLFTVISVVKPHLFSRRLELFPNFKALIPMILAKLL